MNSKLMIAAAALAVAALSAGPALAGDAANGEKLFKKHCVACHTVEQGGANKVGPNQFGIAGREAGKTDGFKYSKAMAESGVVWTDENLDQYIEKPKDFIPKNKMAFNGIKKPEERADVIAYLHTLK